jgi:cytochrome c peroxidase
VVLGAALGGYALGGRAAADGAPFYANPFDKMPDAAALTAIGRKLFSDPSLSAAGKISCATCHDPKHSFGPPDGHHIGVRAVPSLMYAQNVPPFTEHFIDDEGDDSIDQGPAGGRTWDGRAQSLHDQARLPLFAPLEMGDPDADAVVEKVQARYAAAFRRIFGEKIFDDKSLAFKGVLMALEAYQQSPAEFYPYSSKYDAFLRREVALNAQELRGLAAFNDPAKGNCARCHPSALRRGAFPQFTDFGFAAIGVPRNLKVRANRDPGYNDLGLCGPVRADLKNRSEYCGMFRTPTLRNAATRRVFFHNGVLNSLSDVVRFYAERDTKPENWYPRAGDGGILKFDDLPLGFRANLDTKVPFGRRPGDAPALSDEDIADIVAFLETLTDGYR